MSWSPSDYIRNGTYCDTDSILVQLDRCRDHTGSSEAILLVNRGQTVFQSLLLVSQPESEVVGSRQQILLETLVSAPRLQGTDPLPLLANLARCLPGTVDSDWAFITRSTNISSQVNTQSDDHVINDRSLSLSIAFLKPSRPIGGDSNELEFQNTLTMVAASAPVRVHEDIESLLQADRLIEEHGHRHPLHPDLTITPGDSASEDHLAMSMLQVALKLTKSSIGNVYLTTARKRRLRLAAFVGSSSPASELDIERIRQKRKTHSVVTRVYKHNRPLVINNLEEFQRIHPAIKYLGDNSDGAQHSYAELAIPIKQIYSGPQRPTVLGVINVAKVIDLDTGIYGYRDMAALRDIVWRFCLLRSQLLSHISTQSLSKLTRSNSTFDRNWSLLYSDAPEQSDIPIEITGARSAVEDALRHVYLLTRSLSATVRILSPRANALVRFCAYPESVMIDPFPRIQLASVDSVNARVAREGKEQYISTVSEATCRKARKGVQSEICIPIFVSQRLLGTMNLESGYRDAYADALPLVRAMAEQVGLALARSRRVVEDVIWSRAASAAVNVHTLLNAVEKLRVLSTESSLTTTLSADLKLVAQTIDRAIDWTTEVTPEADICDVVDSVVRKLNFTHHVSWVRRLGRPVVIEPLRALAIRWAATAVLENAYRNAAQARGTFSVRLYANECVRGGTLFIRIGIENPLLVKIPDALVRSLYRIPLQLKPDDRLHIGAFVAGAAMRAIGGDVYVDVAETTRLQTTIEVPAVA